MAKSATSSAGVFTIGPFALAALCYSWAMLVVLFRNRLREGVEQEYGEHVGQIYELARSMPGFVSSKDFTADDGERLTIVEFRSAEELLAWRKQADHAAAQQRGREHYYTEYSVQVCEQLRESRFTREG